MHIFGTSLAPIENIRPYSTVVATTNLFSILFYSKVTKMIQIEILIEFSSNVQYKIIIF
jgi:hypothetical protein